MVQRYSIYPYHAEGETWFDWEKDDEGKWMLYSEQIQNLIDENQAMSFSLINIPPFRFPTTEDCIEMLTKLGLQDQALIGDGMRLRDLIIKKMEKNYETK